jgi:hypothetical protein
MDVTRNDRFSARRATRPLTRAAALAAAVAATLAAGGAHAQSAPPADDGDSHIALAVGAAVAGVLVGASIGVNLVTPHVWLQFESGPVPPPPLAPPIAEPPPPPCCYEPQPPPPPPVVAQPAYEPELVLPRMGVSVAGLLQSPRSGQSPVAGIAGALQLRTSPHSLFTIELQSLSAEHEPSGDQRRDLAALFGGRLYPWNAVLAPYLELAGGFGRVSMSGGGLEASTSQLLGRVGLGLEMRLGPHLVLDGAVAQVHGLRLDDPATGSAAAPASDPLFIGHHEQWTEIRGALAYRF